MTLRLFLVALLSAWVGLAAAQVPQSFAKPPLQSAVPKPGPKDLCPVCGMLVAKYPHWVATIVYKDGHAHHFDGAKDMFKFWFDPAKYVAGHSREQMARITVTDYYNLQPVDARAALYVIGSDVLGPMGHELVPLATLADAQDFMKEHQGKRVFSFNEVSPALLIQLDAGKF
jgi:copper chaperone NosL